jgi:hypothetical protein
MAKTFMVLASIIFTLAQYGVNDLPSGWDIDPNQIEGRILPAIATDPNLPRPDPADPNTWLVPIGQYRRTAATNKWVSHVKWVTTSTSDGVFVHCDPNTGVAVEWDLIGWSPPGPWYKVVDVVSWRGQSGETKTQRYTVVGVGIIPADAEPRFQFDKFRRWRQDFRLSLETWGRYCIHWF